VALIEGVGIPESVDPAFPLSNTIEEPRLTPQARGGQWTPSLACHCALPGHPSARYATERNRYMLR
jgi:hypothetical protein